MNNETIQFLNNERSRVGLGETLPHQYVEQVWIALVQGEITQTEFDARTTNIPFCPALVDGFKS